MTWVIGDEKLTSNQISLKEVALHEIGHALGLSHQKCKFPKEIYPREVCEEEYLETTYGCQICDTDPNGEVTSIMSEGTNISFDTRISCGSISPYDISEIRDLYDVGEPQCADDDADGSPNFLDCKPYHGMIFPGANEICGDGIDQDCDGSDMPCSTSNNYQPHVFSANFGDGYYAEIYVIDIDKNATSITVTGPGISGGMDLVYYQPHLRWWHTETPFLDTFVTTDPKIYNFDVFDSEGVHSFQRTITGYVSEFAINLLPTGIVTDPIVFSWTGISGATMYNIELSGENGQFWSRRNISPDTTNIVYDGPTLVEGVVYNYSIISIIETGGETNRSFAGDSFFYGFILDPQVTSTSGVRGADTLSQPGWGFTPNGIAELHFRRPDGSLSPLTTEQIKSDGTYDHNWPIPTDAPAGTYQYWSRDLDSGLYSSEVNYEIKP